MADATEDNDLGKDLAAAFEADNATDPLLNGGSAPEEADDDKKPEDGTTPPAPKDEEGKKPDEPTAPENPDKKPEEPATPPADPAKKPEDGTTPPENPEASSNPEAPTTPEPLTEQGIRKIMSDMRTEERNSGVALDNATKEVMDAYYPEGLTNDLIDQNTGKVLKTPQDVVEATNGAMSTEEAAQWLMNEQFKLDKQVEGIRTRAREVAETTLNFKRDSMAVLEKYEPLFKAYPTLQAKAFNLMMKQVKADEKAGVILEAPDVMDLYDTYLEPYQKAYEFSTKQPATNPTAPAAPGAPAEPAKPGQADRMDEGGDGGTSEVDDPNDFAQQLKKELAKGA